MVQKWICRRRKSGQFCARLDRRNRVTQGNLTPHAPTDPCVKLSIHTDHASLPLETSRSKAYAIRTRFRPVSWLIIACCELSQPLRSIPITETSSLLRVVPPPCPTSVLSLLWVFHLSFSLNIRATGSHVPYKSLCQVHATFMPGAAQTVSRLPLCFSWRYVSRQFWHRP